MSRQNRDGAAAEMDRYKLRHRCEEFLYREAELLDDARLEAWLELLTDDIEYVMPVRVTRAKGSEKSEFKRDAHHFNDDKQVLTQRVERLQREYAWVENPQHRTRRMVGNVRLDDIETDRTGRTEITLKNNLHLTRSREDEDQSTVESAERYDTLREVGGDLKLAKRRILLDHTVTGVLTTFY
jgi:3-phenylpropionate/cinnamic acid dioxygenase small subunit